MEQNKSAVEDFFSNLPKEDNRPSDVFSEKNDEPVKIAKDQSPIPVKGEDEDPEDVDDSVKNRRHRRLEQKLQSEREANIVLNEQLRAALEKPKTQTDGKIDPRLLRAFGTNQAGQEAAAIFQEMLEETARQARESAIHEIEEAEVAESREQTKYESYIDGEMEAIEDKYNIDITSDSPKASKMRREFLELIEDLSPKDEQGMITDYADFGSTFDRWYKPQQSVPDNTRQREIASRSMQRSGGARTPQSPTPGFRGWEKDYFGGKQQ